MIEWIGGLITGIGWSKWNKRKMIINWGMTGQVHGKSDLLGRVSLLEKVHGIAGIGVIDIWKWYDWLLVEVFACDHPNKDEWVYAAQK